MTKLSQLLDVIEQVGMNRSETERLLERLLEFLILDHAVNTLRVDGNITLADPPPNPDSVRDWLLGRTLRDRVPELGGLALFLSAYHDYSFTPAGRSEEVRAGGCTFPVACPYSSREDAMRVGVSIERDHILPRSRGGLGTPWQFQPLCRPHNLLKGNALFWNQSVLPIRGWCEDG